MIQAEKPVTVLQAVMPVLFHELFPAHLVPAKE
jgi:hypothetical protein